MKELSIEEKELLLKDLCSRLPYHVRVKVWLKDGTTEEGILDLEHNYCDVLRDAFYYNKIVNIKPYLRSRFSMTEEEKMIQRSKMRCEGYFVNHVYYHTLEEFDYLNSIHVDYRTDDKGKTMIERGLAIEAPDGMYNIKKK